MSEWEGLVFPTKNLKYVKSSIGERGGWWYGYGMTEQIGAHRENGPERVLSREEVLSKILSYCEHFAIERELVDEAGIYLLEVIAEDKSRRYSYQRKRILPGQPTDIESAGTTIRSEDLDDGYSRTHADFDAAKNQWIEQ